MIKVFISCHSTSIVFAKEVREKLIEWGYETSLYSDFFNMSKVSFSEQLENELKSSDLVIAIVTSSAVESPEVEAEWRFAYRSKGKKRLLLLQYEKVELPYWLSGIQNIDFTINTNASFQHLKLALQGSDSSDYNLPLLLNPVQLIYISYARKDVEFAKRVREKLEKYGYRTWMDIFDIKTPSNWMDAIDSALRKASAIIGIISVDSVQSPYINKEWDWALEHNLSLVFLCLEECDLPNYYSDVQRINVTEDSDNTFEHLKLKLHSRSKNFSEESKASKLLTKAGLKIFVSYSSKDLEIMKPLVQQIEHLKHNVWFDRELKSTAGQSWWDNILQQIRDCDLFVFALTSESLASYPCRLEYTYAYSLNKRILPVMLSRFDPGVLPAPLATIQFVDYTLDTASLMLEESIAKLPSPIPIPNPLPEPPPVPVTELNKLATQIDGIIDDEDTQLLIVAKLEKYLDEVKNREGALFLLTRLLEKPGLFASADRKIQRLLREYKP